MDVRLKPGTEVRLRELAALSGRPTDELVEDAMASYLTEVGEVRSMLARRLDEIRSGRVESIVAEPFLRFLRSGENR